MPKRPHYRSAIPPVDPVTGPVRVWHLLVALPVLTVMVAGIIAGPLLVVVASVAFNAIWAVMILLPATVFGLLCTARLARTRAIRESPWPDAWRIVISAGVGLGAISLGMLLLGSLHGLTDGIPGVMLIVLTAAGYPVASGFVRAIDKTPFTRALRWPDAALLLAALPLGCLLVASTFPPGTLWHTEGYGYDVLEYHLQLARQFSAANSTAPVVGNIYSYLSLNIEMLYTLIASLARSLAGADYLYPLIYGAQALHATITVLAAVAIGLIPIPLSRLGRIAAFVAVLAVPWTLVIGSLAYNDGAVLLYGALAVGLTVADLTLDSAVILGIVLGLAVGCKMTAGVMICVPAGLVLVVRQKYRALAVATVVALLLYSPWMARSMVFTHTRRQLGNPIFPVFSGTLGRGHWSKSLALRFDRGHRPPAASASFSGHVSALLGQSILDRQWSPGLAAWAGLLHHPPRLGSRGRWPWHIGMLWLAIIPALVLAILRGRAAVMLLIFLLVQVMAWLTCTQLEARFLLPTILPMAVLLGLAADAVPAFRRLVWIILAGQALFCGLLLGPEAGLLAGPQNAHRPPLIGALLSLPEDWIDSAIPAHLFTNRDVIYLEGYSSPLYVHGRVIYNTVFNRNMLARAFKRGGARGAMAWLRRQGVNYLILDWNEVQRLRRTYGFDPVITPRNINAMIPLGLIPLAVKTAPGIQIFEVARPAPAAVRPLPG